MFKLRAKFFSAVKLFEASSTRIATCYCSSTAKETVVLASSSDDPYENLALEDWLYQNEDASKKRIIYIYRNKPTVVIGRFQNPWVECQVRQLKKFQTLLVRRRSGGGTVFHDLGNMNISVLTSKAEYDRQANLRLVADAIRRKWNVDAAATKRHDILLDDQFKISGTASKVGGKQAYHHFTLLFNSNLDLLKNILDGDRNAITSKATSSIPGTVINLSDKVPNIDYDQLKDVLSQEFLIKYTGGQAEVLDVDPTDNTVYPGVQDIIKELKSWKWNFGKTPDFTYRKRIPTSIGELEIVLKASSGIIHFVEFNVDVEVEGLDTLMFKLGDVIRGSRFSRSEVTSELGMYLSENSDIIPNDQMVVCKELIHWLSDHM